MIGSKASTERAAALAKGELIVGSAAAEDAAPHVEGVLMVCYGASQLVNTGNAVASQWDRLKARIRPYLSVNRAVAGSQVADACALAYGSATATIGEGSSPIAGLGTVSDGFWTVGANFGGIVVVDALGNDAGLRSSTAAGGTTAKSDKGATNGLDALLRLLRAGSKISNAPSASVVYTGSWGSLPTPVISGGIVYYTSTLGDKVTISHTGPDVDVIAVGFDEIGFGNGPGATYELRIDGALKASGTTNDQTRKTNGSGSFGNGFGQLAIPCRGMGPGAHSIELKHTGGGFLELDSVLVPSDTPPTIVVSKMPPMGAAGLAAMGTTQANFDAMNAIIDTVCARFPDDGSLIVYDPTLSGSWDAATMLGSWDGAHVHYNDRGAAHNAGEIMALLNAGTYRAGQNRV